MNNAFWTNTIWYLALLAISAAVFSAALIKSKNRRFTFGFWLSVLGFTYLLEAILVLLLDSYLYHPMIFPSDPFFDSVMGNIFSQTSVSSSAVLLCVLQFKTRLRAVIVLAAFSLAYFLIDLFFSSHGLYEHHWYRSVYTLVGFFVFGTGIKYWHKRMQSSPPQWFYMPALFLGAFAATANTLGTVFKASGLRIFRSGLIADASRDHTVTMLIYGPLIIISMIALRKLKVRFAGWMFALSVIFACQITLLITGVMRTPPFFGPLIALADISGYYGAVMLEDRLLTKGGLAGFDNRREFRENI